MMRKYNLKVEGYPRRKILMENTDSKSKSLLWSVMFDIMLGRHVC